MSDERLEVRGEVWRWWGWRVVVETEVFGGFLCFESRGVLHDFMQYDLSGKCRIMQGVTLVSLEYNIYMH